MKFLLYLFLSVKNSINFIQVGDKHAEEEEEGEKEKEDEGEKEEEQIGDEENRDGGGGGGGGSRDELKRDSWMSKLERTQIRER